MHINNAQPALCNLITGNYLDVCVPCLQFAVGSVFALMLWTFGLLKKPEFTKDTVQLNPCLVAVFMLAYG